MLATVFNRVSHSSLRRSMMSTATALDAFKKSCYQDNGFVISDQETVEKAVEKLSNYGMGCLLTTDVNGHLSGVVSERDIVQKVALLDCPTTAVKVNEISTPNPITVDPSLPLHECMSIMIKRDIRHLPIVSDATGVLLGMISIKDCVKTVIDEKEETIHILSNFALGKTGTFVVD